MNNVCNKCIDHFFWRNVKIHILRYHTALPVINILHLTSYANVTAIDVIFLFMLRFFYKKTSLVWRHAFLKRSFYVFYVCVISNCFYLLAVQKYNFFLKLLYCISTHQMAYLKWGCHISFVSVYAFLTKPSFLCFVCWMDLYEFDSAYELFLCFKWW